MFSFRLLVDGLLFVVGLCWCRAMFRRWRKDLDELRTSRELRDWAVIAALWGVTAFVLVCLIGTSVGVVRSIARI
jgi:hypothetical protein